MTRSSSAPSTSLFEDGDDLRKLPLHLRKMNLQRPLARRPEGVFVSEFERGEIGQTYSVLHVGWLRARLEASRATISSRQVSALDEDEEPHASGDGAGAGRPALTRHNQENKCTRLTCERVDMLRAEAHARAMPNLDTCVEILRRLIAKGDMNGLPLAERAINEYWEIALEKARKSGLRLVQQDVLAQRNAVLGATRLCSSREQLYRKEAERRIEGESAPCAFKKTVPALS